MSIGPSLECGVERSWNENVRLAQYSETDISMCALKGYICRKAERTTKCIPVKYCMPENRLAAV